MHTDTTSATQLSKLLATRMCHDLAGPLGGISNGVEFLGDSIGDEDMARQSLSLLQLSSGEGSAKLQIFRQAYGIINQVGGKTDLSLIKQTFDDFFEHSKISVEWNLGTTTEIDHHSRQILVNLVIICSSCLIMGGNINITIDDPGSITIKGDGAQIKADKMLDNIFSGESAIDEITPHNVQAYFTYILAKELSSELSYTPQDDCVILSVKDLP